MKFKKIIAFNIALIAICANSVMSVSALSFPELNVPELEYTPLEIPEDMPSPYENFEEKKAEKMQSLLNKGYGQSYSLGALSMPSGYGQTATDVYNRIGDKSFGEGWQEWGSQIEVPEYSSLASKHATIRAEGQANMDALPSGEQRYNESKYKLLSSDENAAYAYDKAQEAKIKNATIGIEKEISKLTSEYGALSSLIISDPLNKDEYEKEQAKITTQLQNLNMQKEEIVASLTGETGEIKGSDYFLNTTNPDGTQTYAALRSYYGYQTVSADPWKDIKAFNAMKNNEETTKSNAETKMENVSTIAETEANQKMQTIILTQIDKAANNANNANSSTDKILEKPSIEQKRKIEGLCNKINNPAFDSIQRMDAQNELASATKHMNLTTQERAIVNAYINANWDPYKTVDGKNFTEFANEALIEDRENYNPDFYYVFPEVEDTYRFNSNA